MDEIIIIGSDCSDCIHCVMINEDDPRNIGVHCQVKDKKYRWGQCVPCAYHETKK